MKALHGSGFELDQNGEYNIVGGTTETIPTNSIYDPWEDEELYFSGYFIIIDTIGLNDNTMYEGNDVEISITEHADES